MEYWQRTNAGVPIQRGACALLGQLWGFIKARGAACVTTSGRRFLLGVTAALIPLVTPPAAAQADAPNPGSQSLDAEVAEHRRQYQAAFPEILFVTLKGGKDWSGELVGLSVLLGHQPRSLDYEHPQHLRADLMDLSLARLRLMLQHRAPSASLFRADEPQGWAENICVITLDPCIIASDDAQATAHLLDLDPEAKARIPARFRLDCDEYLRFVFDHEAYHCLSSLYGGPQPRSFEPLWAEYWHYLSELGADGYALGMHLARRGEVTPFARNLQRIRGTALYAGDIDHWTYPALEHVLQRGPASFRGLTRRQIFEQAEDIRRHLLPDYASYLIYRRAALAAMRRLDLPEQAGNGTDVHLEGVRADPGLAEDIARQAERCRRELLERQPVADGEAAAEPEESAEEQPVPALSP